MFTAAMFIFCQLPKYVEAQNKHSISSHGLARLDCHYVEVEQPAYQADQAVIVKAAWHGSMWSEIFSQIKCIFTGFPTKRAVKVDYLANRLHIISSLFCHFHLLKNAFLHKKKILSPIFLECTFFWLQLLISCDYLFGLIFASSTVSWGFNIYII